MDKTVKTTLNFKSDEREKPLKNDKSAKYFADDFPENRKKHKALSYLFSLQSLDILM